MVSIRFLGTAQDGGIPHANCSCKACLSITRRVASIAIQGESSTIIDATPDFSDQVSTLGLNDFSQLTGIIITHLHIGHYLGLLQLGKEMANTKRLPVFLTAENYQFLRVNKPFSYLIKHNQILPKIIELGNTYSPSSDYQITPIEVPHRNEDGNTIGIIISTDQSNTVYIPDIDYLDHNTLSVIKEADNIIFDGTFYSSSEIPRQSNVPHPPISSTIDQLSPYIDDKVFYFTHFNHTNPILTDIQLAKTVEQSGFHLAIDGLEIEI